MKANARPNPRYVPDRGDAVWWMFEPQVGHEQSGRRPAVVLTPRTYNAKSGLAILCPITSKTKGYPFDVVIPEGLPISGVIQADQLRSADWRARDASRICALPVALIDDVLGKIQTLVGR